MSASWRWILFDEQGQELEASAVRVPASFPSQADAEAWIGLGWTLLSDAGCDAVTLVHGEEVVYGPMSLRPAQS